MSEQPGRRGLLGHDLSGVPAEEVRFGVVLNGGVSLAVWMGGVALELDRLVKAPARQDEPYAALLRLTGCTARVDVISGTSAGGVNGAALALAQVNRRADIAALRDVWVEQGRIEALLRQPFRGAPSSLLKGDEHFLPQLNAALTSLAVPDRHRAAQGRADRPHDDDDGAARQPGGHRRRPRPAAAAVGARRPGSTGSARSTSEPDDGPVRPARIRDTAAQLALAARGSSSFPAGVRAGVRAGLAARGRRAGSPATDVGPAPGHERRRRGLGRRLPGAQPLALRRRRRGAGEHAHPGRGRGDRADAGRRPGAPRHAARLPARARAGPRPRRRARRRPDPDRRPRPGCSVPSRRRAAAPSSTSSRTTTSGRRAVGAPAPTCSAGSTSRWPRGQMQTPRGAWAASSSRTTAGCASGTPRATSPAVRCGSGPPASWPEQGEVWDYERIRRAAERAQQEVEDARRGLPGADPPPIRAIPYVPDAYPTRAAPDAGAHWQWGVTGAISVAEAANELLRELVWVLPAGDRLGRRAQGAQAGDRADPPASGRAAHSPTGRGRTDEVLDRPAPRPPLLDAAARVLRPADDGRPATTRCARPSPTSPARRTSAGSWSATTRAQPTPGAHRHRGASSGALLDDPAAHRPAAPGAAVRAAGRAVVAELLSRRSPCCARYCDAAPDGRVAGRQSPSATCGSLHRWRAALCPGDRGGHGIRPADDPAPARGGEHDHRRRDDHRVDDPDRRRAALGADRQRLRPVQPHRRRQARRLVGQALRRLPQAVLAGQRLDLGAAGRRDRAVPHDAAPGAGASGGPPVRLPRHRPRPARAGRGDRRRPRSSACFGGTGLEDDRAASRRCAVDAVAELTGRVHPSTHPDLPAAARDAGAGPPVRLGDPARRRCPAEVGATRRRDP